MMRSVGMILSACCVATVCSEVIGLGVLLYRGQLNASTLKNVRAALSGQEFEAPTSPEATQFEEISSDDVVKDRSLRVLEFSSLQHQLTALKSMVDSNKTSLLAEKDQFLKMQEDFERRLKALDEERTSEASVKAQAVLLAMAPADAVNSLMRLTLEENVMLLNEMPEKKVAALLKEFSTVANDAQRVTRGQEVFEALSRGEPARKLIRDTAAQLGATSNPETETASAPATGETPRGN